LRIPGGANVIELITNAGIGSDRWVPVIIQLQIHVRILGKSMCPATEHVTATDTQHDPPVGIFSSPRRIRRPAMSDCPATMSSASMRNPSASPSTMNQKLLFPSGTLRRHD